MVLRRRDFVYIRGKWDHQINIGRLRLTQVESQILGRLSRINFFALPILAPAGCIDTNFLERALILHALNELIPRRLGLGSGARGLSRFSQGLPLLLLLAGRVGLAGVSSEVHHRPHAAED